MQTIRGMAEGPSGPYYKHSQGVRCSHNFQVYLVMGGDCKERPLFYPNRFPPEEVENTLQHDIVDVPYHQHEGDDTTMLRKHIYRNFHACPCAIYESARPGYASTGERTILRGNFNKRFNNDDQYSTTSLTL